MCTKKELGAYTKKFKHNKVPLIKIIVYFFSFNILINKNNCNVEGKIPIILWKCVAYAFPIFLKEKP